MEIFNKHLSVICRRWNSMRQARATEDLGNDNAPQSD